MENQASSVGLGAIAFASTNIDDLFVLLLFFSTPGFRSFQVVLGQFLGIGILTFGSLVCSFAARTMPTIYIGLLGLLPLGLGMKALWEHSQVKDEDDGSVTTPRSSSSAIFSVALVTIANGADNFAVYTPLFSTRPLLNVGAMVVTFLVMTALWCAISHYLVNHPMLKRPIEHYGHKIFPWVLIALGGFILTEAYLNQ